MTTNDNELAAIAHEKRHHFTLRDAYARVLSAEHAAAMIAEVEDDKAVYTLFAIARSSQQTTVHILRTLYNIMALPKSTRDTCLALELRAERALERATDRYWEKFPEMASGSETEEHL